MSRKRTAHDLRMVAKNQLADYFSRLMDEFIFVYLSGARGINEDYLEDVLWAGHATNPIQAPDATHTIYGGAATSKATIATTDTMSRLMIERANTKAKMMQAQNPDVANMVPVKVDGEERYVCLMSPFQEHSLRTSDAAGWLEIQKAAAAAEGRNNPIFKGGLGMIDDTVLHSHRNVIRFSDYGATANLPAARALFLGRQAGVVAYGTAGGMKWDWNEKQKDYDNEPSVSAGTIFGFKKSRFNGSDFGVLSIDTYAPNPN